MTKKIPTILTITTFVIITLFLSGSVQADVENNKSDGKGPGNVTSFKLINEEKQGSPVLKIPTKEELDAITKDYPLIGNEKVVDEINQESLPISEKIELLKERIVKDKLSMSSYNLTIRDSPYKATVTCEIKGNIVHYSFSSQARLGEFFEQMSSASDILYNDTTKGNAVLVDFSEIFLELTPGNGIYYPEKSYKFDRELHVFIRGRFKHIDLESELSFEDQLKRVLQHIVINKVLWERSPDGRYASKTHKYTVNIFGTLATEKIKQKYFVEFTDGDRRLDVVYSRDRWRRVYGIKYYKPREKEQMLCSDDLVQLKSYASDELKFLVNEIYTLMVTDIKESRNWISTRR